MSSRPLKLLLLSGLGISLFLGNSAAMAQVVVPTDGSDSSTSIPSSRDRDYTASNSDSASRFVCQTYNGRPTVMYQPRTQPGQYYPWASPATLGGGWDSQLRCDTIAQRLTTYIPQGMVELRTGVQNRQNIICVTTEQGNGDCQIVVTVPPNRDPINVRNQIFANLDSADNGENTLPVSTYGSRRSQGGALGDIIGAADNVINGGKKRTSKSGINLKPYLAPADGGTGARMGKGVRIKQTTNSGSLRLNPKRF